MKRVRYTVSVKGLPTPRGSISFSALRKILDLLADGSERALRLALEGESVKTGPVPEWLAQSAEFILTAIRPGSTTLVFDAPTLGEVASDQIRQPDLWETVPAPDETALTVLAKSVADAEQENLDSERYDLGVLETLLGFKRILAEDNIKIRLASAKGRREGFTLDSHAFQKIERIKKSTPEPQAALLTGYLNLIQHSERKFQLKLENGQTVRGRIDESLISLEQLRSLWGKKVTIKGILYFAASQKPRLFEAQVINPRQVGDHVLATLSLPLPRMDVLAQVKRQVSSKDIVSEIWGKWPGDESIDDILGSLEAPEADRR
jgi:hypothetical protein